MRITAPLLLFVSLVLSLSASSADAKGVVNFFGGTGVQGGMFGVANGGVGGVAVNQAGTGGVAAGSVYVVDRGNNRVQQFSSSGEFIRAFGRNVGGAGIHLCTAAPNCVAGTASADAGAMSSPQGIAIEQATGNVYVTDQNNRRVDVFSATGAFQGAFGWGVDSGAAAFELCSTASGCQAPNTTAPTGGEAGKFGTAIGYPAVNPATGELAVADKSNRRIDVFKPTIAAGEVTAVSFSRAYGFDVVASGPDNTGTGFEVCAIEVNPTDVCKQGSGGSGLGQFASTNSPSALAIDTAGNSYVLDPGNNRAQKFSAAPGPLAIFATAQLSGAPAPVDIALNPANGRLLVAKPCNATLCAGAVVSNEVRVFELDAGGTLLDTHAANAGITAAAGVAPGQPSGNVYLAAQVGQAKHGVFILHNVVPPTAVTEAPDPLTAHTATLKGKVNPKGFETSYRFEFSRNGGSTWEKLPETDIPVGSGNTDVTVEREVTGLVGGSQYRFRIVATKPFGAGTVTTAPRIFTTPASAPDIAATYTTAVTTNTAVLEAEINPSNQATTYRFEWGAEDCEVSACTSVPISDAAIGSGAQPVNVAKEIAGLTPGTTYHFRVVASNASGTTEGPDTTFATFEEMALRTDCANQAFRVGPAALLPNCRAYEMVSPVDKNGADIRGTVGLTDARAEYIQATPDGEKITYSSPAAFGDQISSRKSNQYLATRTATEWTSTGINPPAGLTIASPLIIFSSDFETQFKLFKPDLSAAWVVNQNETPLTPDAAPGWTNLYRQAVPSQNYEALTTHVPTTPYEAFDYAKYEEFLEVQGHSADFEHVLFIAKADYTADSLSNKASRIYDYSGGQLHLVSVLPDGTPNPSDSNVGTVRNPPANQELYGTVANAVSDDGSHVYWSSTVNTLLGEIYLRTNPDQPQSALTGSDECTEPEKACTVPVSGGLAQFWTASSDGERAIYSTGSLEHGEATLHEFDAETGASTPIASEVSGVVGASEDTSHLYFVSREALDAGATAGEPNLYLERSGDFRFIATLSPSDTGSLDDRNVFVQISGRVTIDSALPRWRASRVAPDGRHVAFQSARSLTGYDNTDAVNGRPALEVYLYDAEADKLICVSCNPTGSRPNGKGLPRPYATRLDVTTDLWAAAWLPTMPRPLHAPRALAPDGSRLFFNSFDALVPYDSNGAQDVYQWEAHGTGECDKAQGCLSMLSTGLDSIASEFVEASSSGNDVFLRTSDSIDPRDRGLFDIYDARVLGGYPPPAPPPVPCVGDACQGAPEPPVDPTPASASFRGAGDPSARSARRRCGPKRKRAAARKRAGKPSSSRSRRVRPAGARHSAKRKSRCRSARRGPGR